MAHRGSILLDGKLIYSSLGHLSEQQSSGRAQISMGTITETLCQRVRITEPLVWILALSTGALQRSFCRQGLVPLSGRSAGSWAALARKGPAGQHFVCMFGCGSHTSGLPFGVSAGSQLH